MSSWGGEFRAAYAGSGRWVGIGLAGLALFSWASNAFSLTLAQFIADVVATYRALLHPVVELLFGWLFLRFPDWWKDVAVFYFVLGGAVARTLLTLYKRHDPTKGEVFGPPIFGRFSRKTTQIAAVILTVPLWPLALASILSVPYVMQNEVNRNVFSADRANRDRLRIRKNVRFLFNLRWVFVLQLVAVVGIVLMIIALNMAGLGHLAR